MIIKKHVILAIFCLTISFTLILNPSFYSPLLSGNLNQHDTIHLVISQENLCNEDEIHFPGHSEPINSRAPSINLIISKDETREFNKDRIVNNVTIRDDATMIIRDCEFQINGSLKVMDNARLFIMNSTVHVLPGPVGLQDIIINFSNNAHVQITDSNLYTHPQPTVTNISYLISDDSSEVIIIRSYVNIKLPEIFNLDIEVTPPTAGTFILTGETNWNIQNTTIEGYLYFDETDMLTGRWFIFTLQRRARLVMKDAVGSIENDDTQPFIKPVSGSVRLENCIIRKGVIDNEVVGELEAINLTIKKLNLRDQTKTKVYRSQIINSTDLGSIAIFSPETDGEKPKAILYMEDTIIGTEIAAEGMLLTSGNSTATIINSKLKKCSLNSNSNIRFIDCNIEQSSEAKENATITLDNSSNSNIVLNDKSDLNVYSSPEIPFIKKIITGYNCESIINLHHTKVNEIEVWAGDSIPPAKYDSAYEPDRNISQVTINLIGTELKKLFSFDDAKISLTLQNSKVNKFAFDQYKNESVKVSILNVDSEYALPDPWPGIDLEIDIYHKIHLTTKVNEEFVHADISVFNNNEHVLSTQANEQGTAEIDLLFMKYIADGYESAGEYSLNLNYLGFSDTIKTTAEMGDSYIKNWIDNTQPVIGNISIDSSYQRTERGTYIRATITDMDIKVVANATIYYQVKENNTWSDLDDAQMIEIENNTYEGIIPQQNPGTKVRFYIVAYDIVGNYAESDEHVYEIEDTQFTISVLILIVVIILIILFFLYIYKRRIKVKQYLNKSKKEYLRETNGNK